MYAIRLFDSNPEFILTRIITKLESMYQIHKIHLNTSEMAVTLNGRFNVLSLLGNGGFCQVFKAKDIQASNLVAIKKIDKTKKISQTADHDKVHWKLRQILEKEANIMRSFNHVNIIKCLDFFSDDNNTFLVLEHAVKGELFNVVVTKGFLSESESGFIMNQLLEAVKYIHNQGFVHRDLNLENLLLEKADIKSQLKSCDFDNGINAATSASIMNTGAIQQMQQGIAVRFRISDTKEEIEFNVNYRQCLVDVKKQICNLWKATSPHDYKIMELLYNGDPLPNNQYFVPLICLKNDPIECRLDQSVDHNEFVVLHIQGEICVPDSLQMRKTQNIVQLKSLISNFINDEKILVLKKENMVLEDKSTLEDCGISDGDWIKIIKKHMGKIVIRSIFENDPLTVEYSNKDKIFEIIKTATNKFGINPDTFVLYFNEECLEEDKCVWEYGIDSLSPVMFYCLKGLEDVEINKDPSDRGYLSELYHAKDKLDNKMLILKYRDSIENFEKKFLKELISIQLKDSPSEFLKIKGIYKNNNMIHVVIEYMEFGSLTMLLQKEEILEEEIIKWSVQILQCLGNLHRDKLYYMDLKPFELFIDSERKIKFLKFNITTFTKNEREPKIMEKIEKRGDKTVSKIHLAPEIQDGKDGDEKADIWSFGVILINIINGKPPEAHWDDKLDRLHYVLKREISNDLKNLIDSCVQKDPRKRPTIEFLLRNNLFKSYIIPRK